MFIGNCFILCTDLLQNFVQVLLRCGIYLYVDIACKLRTQCCQLLNKQRKKMDLDLFECFSLFSSIE